MTLTEIKKNEIVDALERYMSDHSISQNALATQSNINALYIIAMRKREWVVTTGTKKIEIKDFYFERLASFIGIELNLTTIEAKPTDQFSFIISRLNNAKENAETTVIIGETGAGKTFALGRFKIKNPNGVYSIKVGSNDGINDLLNKINNEVNAYLHRVTKSSKITDICARLQLLKNQGNKPILVFDESEYLKQPAICAVKEIHDALLGVCPIVLIGTNELLDNIKSMVIRRKPGIAQFHRRIKFKTHFVPKIDKKYPLFLENLTAEVKNWLRDNCDNYGELTDVLQPVYRESQRLNQPITIQFIQTVLGL